MNVDDDIFIKTCKRLQSGGGAAIGPWSSETAAWFMRHGLPEPLQQLFRSHAPKTDIWAGAGTLFGEANVLKWNDWFPEACRSQLLIVGSAANGDHIAIDLKDGRVGYISHEHDWRSKPRDFFIPVSVSFGRYLDGINNERPKVPADYWQAKSSTGPVRQRP